MLRHLANFGIGTLAAVATAALAALSAAADADDETVNIEQISCREMLKMEGEERDLTLIFMHGFVSGEKAAPELDETELSDATETILDTCIDNPGDSVLSVFHKVRG